MFIDAHLHVFPRGSKAARVLGYSNETDALLKEMDEALVDAGVVVGLPELQTAEELLEICRKAPSRLFPLLGVSPNDKDWEDAIEAAWKMGFHGLKLHPRLNAYPADDTRLDPILHAAKEAGLPVMLDTIVPTGQQPLEALDWRAIDRLAKRNPETTLVLAHACPPYVLHGFMLAKANLNVYLDLSSTVKYYEGTSVMKDILFLSRKLDLSLIYGSDYPDFGVKAYQSAYQRLIEGYDDIEQNKIFYENAIDVYHLPLTP